jgi:hypothetical protein
VINVLLMPMNRPATTTHVANTALLSVATAITTSVADIARRLTVSVGTVPNRRCRRGATTTEVNASARPQPKKISPIWWALMSSGNGVNASSVKKPKLYSRAVIATPSRPR